MISKNNISEYASKSKVKVGQRGKGKTKPSADKTVAKPVDNKKIDKPTGKSQQTDPSFNFSNQYQIDINSAAAFAIWGRYEDLKLKMSTKMSTEFLPGRMPEEIRVIINRIQETIFDTHIENVKKHGDENENTFEERIQNDIAAAIEKIENYEVFKERLVSDDFKISSYELKIFTRQASEEIRKLIDKQIKRGDAEASPVEISDVERSLSDYIDEKFSIQAGRALTEKVLKLDESLYADCYKSHPFALVAGLFYGGYWGALNRNPLAKRILLGTYKPLKLPYWVAKGGYALAKKRPKTALAVGSVAAAAAGAGYVFGPDVVELVKGTLESAADITLTSEKELREKFNGMIGEMELQQLPDLFSTVFNIAVGDQKGAQKSIENVWNDYVNNKAWKFLDQMDIPETGPRMKKEFLGPITDMLNQATQNEKDRKGVDSINCFLYTMAGSAIVGQLARKPVLNSYTMVRQGMTTVARDFGEGLKRNFTAGGAKSKLLDDKAKFHDLLLWMEIVSPENMAHMGKNNKLDELGELRSSKLGFNQKDFSAKLVDSSGKPLGSRLVKFDNLSPDTQKYIDKIYPGAIDAKRLESTGQKWVKIDAPRINQDLRSISDLAMEKTEREIVANARDIYRKSSIDDRLVRIKTVLTSPTTQRRILVQSYKETSKLIKSLDEIKFGLKDGGLLKAEEVISKIESAEKNLNKLIRDFEIPVGVIGDIQKNIRDVIVKETGSLDIKKLKNVSKIKSDEIAEKFMDELSFLSLSKSSEIGARRWNRIKTFFGKGSNVKRPDGPLETAVKDMVEAQILGSQLNYTLYQIDNLFDLQRVSSARMGKGYTGPRNYDEYVVGTNPNAYERYQKVKEFMARINDLDINRVLKVKENNQQNRKTIMSKKDIRDLVSEVLNEGYGKYPYHANEYSESEPDEDYMVEWKALVDEVCGSKKRNFDGDPKTMEDAAVEVAKLFVKDSELFREVLELAGSNKSVGVEILQQLKGVKEKKKLDKELDV